MIQLEILIKLHVSGQLQQAFNFHTFRQNDTQLPGYVASKFRILRYLVKVHMVPFSRDGH